MADDIDVSVKPFFTSEELDTLAKETEFVKRSSAQLTGSIFLDAIVFNSENLMRESLDDLASDMLDDFNINIKKQSLNERFNKNAVSFLRASLEKVLSKQITNKNILKEFKEFKRVIIKDATSFQIHPTLKDSFKGSGGSGSDAAMKIQFEYDILTGKIIDLSINAFVDQDATNSIETITLTKEGDLIIRDLAYMTLDVLEKISEFKGFFLCRPQQNIKVYELKKNELILLNFVILRKEMEKNKISVIEKKVFLGKEHKFSVRLIINFLPQDVISKRLAKAKKENQKRNKKKKCGALTAEYIARAHFNLIITNTTKNQIKASSAYSIYTVRWQIELVFKAWKSICDLEKAYKKVKRERIEAYIYGKLLFIVLGWQIFWSLCKILYQTEGLLISMYKFLKTWMKKVSTISSVLLGEDKNTLKFVSNLYERSKIYHLLETRKNDNTCFELLLDSAGSLKLGQKQYKL